jgi:hypothetical protein
LSDIFREIDEELRRDNLAKLWERYGAYLIGLAVLVVVVTGAVVGWREYSARELRAEGARYAAAADLARSGQDDKAALAFAGIAREASGGHALLARFEEAALKARLGDEGGAVAIYDALANDGSVDRSYRDLATILSAMHGLSAAADPKALVERVAPLTAPGQPWRASALEVTALAKLKAGDREGAVQAYKQVSDDPTAPQGIRARAAEMVAALGG